MCLCVEVPYILTGNKLYRAAGAYSGGAARVHKSNEARELQWTIVDQIDALDMHAPPKAFGYTCHAAFFMKGKDWIIKDESKLRRLDLSNLWKIVEDAVFTGAKFEYFDGLGIDDSLDGFCITSKNCLPDYFDDLPFYIAIEITFYGRENITVERKPKRDLSYFDL